MAVLRSIDGCALVLRAEDGGELLSIAQTLCGGRMRLAVRGDITMDLAHEFEDELITAALACPDLEIDLGGAGFLCAPALRALLSARQLLIKAGGKMRLTGVNGAVYGKCREAGLDELIEIDPPRG